MHNQRKYRDCGYFSPTIIPEESYHYPDFMFYCCADGKGKVADKILDLGETIFIPAGYGPVELSGEMDLIALSYHG